MDEEVWIFGYGSLVWRPSFPYHKKVAGFIKGYKRRFFQASTDHRGVPESPGRVVTLIELDHLDDPTEKTWGVAYLVPADKVSEVIEYLDYREKGGYSQARVDVFAIDDHEKPAIRNALIYMATQSNPQYLGPAAMEEIAAQIFRSEGPSGKNVEYLYQLAHSLREMGVTDGHVFQLEDLVKAMELDQRDRT
eukprot:TRINITY_DN3496_c0_g1_i4.p1 TRINITY_DN3496_c0_g1~~TRINITY_DN3496_c0_g1_i4.p1  ORF type:complete len:192 (-),score=50.58 TRINITY_DN3496_c0_g1_i4:22-597(-)